MSWLKTMESFDLHYSMFNFQLSESKDLFQLAYAIPLEVLYLNQTGRSDPFLETGIAVFDSVMKRQFYTLHSMKATDPSDYWIRDGFLIDEFEIPLDRNNVSGSVSLELWND